DLEVFASDGWREVSRLQPLWIAPPMLGGAFPRGNCCPQVSALAGCSLRSARSRRVAAAPSAPRASRLREPPTPAPSPSLGTSSKAPCPVPRSPLTSWTPQ